MTKTVVSSVLQTNPILDISNLALEVLGYLSAESVSGSI